MPRGVAEGGAPGHVVLLGDSIFDNAAYVHGGPDVVAQLRRVLPPGWQATLLAVDGAVLRDVHGQLARIPAGATHLVLSAGGNDALGHVDILQRPARSAADVLAHLADIRDLFAEAYAGVLDAALRTGLPLTACTIYEGCFPDARMQRLLSAALTVFNDTIVREVVRRALGLIDLRLACDAPAHYANPIEPSEQGGARIAEAILRSLTDGNAPGLLPATGPRASEALPGGSHTRPNRMERTMGKSNRDELVKGLNEDLRGEFQAVIMYRLFASMVQGPYRQELRAFFEAEIPEELAHAQMLADKISALGATPAAEAAAVRVSGDAREMLQIALDAEVETLDRYVTRRKQAEEAGEHGLAIAFDDLIADESRHRDELRQMLARWP